jgi:hypothetical protein
LTWSEDVVKQAKSKYMAVKEKDGHREEAEFWLKVTGLADDVNEKVVQTYTQLSKLDDGFAKCISMKQKSDERSKKMAHRKRIVRSQRKMQDGHRCSKIKRKENVFIFTCICVCVSNPRFNLGKV